MRKNCTIKFLLISLFVVWSPLVLYSEGTKEIRPTSADNSGIQITPQVDPTKPFARFGVDSNYRLNVHVCEPGETIQMGFGELAANRQVRLVDPDGLIVVNPTNLGIANTPGYIANYNQAVAGPVSTTNPTGYVPISYTTTKAGDYSIEFSNNTSTINLFDITVIGADGTVKKGRLWSKAWLLNTANYNNPFNGSMYIYTDDKITTKINFNGIQPYEFMISANSTGTNNTGNIINDRKSVYGNSTYPQYKIFLNAPDSTCYPTGFLGSIVGNPTITGCPGDYCINVEVTAPGIMQFSLNADGIPGIQIGGKDRLIQASLKAGVNCIKWDGKDGLGGKIDTNIVRFDMGISYINGLSHLPIYDVENHKNGYIVTYVRPSTAVGGNIPLQWDDSNLRPGTNTDQQTNLPGCMLNGCHRWHDRGVTNGAPCPGCPETVNTWWFVKESQAKVTNLIKNKDVDANRNKPGKGISNDTTVCASEISLPLNGYMKGDTGVIWTLKKGDGQFVSNSNISTRYVFGTNDKKNNNVTFLIATRGDVCPPVYDSMRVFYDPIKTLKINQPVQVCSNTPQSIDIVSSLTNATKITWTGGSGSVAPNRTTANIKYTPTNQELNLGTVKLIANTNDVVFKCPNVKDSVLLKLLIPPTVVAPKDTLFCDEIKNIILNLNAKHTHTDSIQWFANNSDFSFNKTSGDSVSGKIINNNPITIRVEAYRKGCTTAIDDMSIKFSPQKSINGTGPDSICATNPLINLSSTMQNATNVLWKNASGVAILNNTSPAILYSPNSSEITQGFTKFYVSTNDPNPVCPNKMDSLLVKLKLPPSVIAPNDTIFCVETTNIPLNLTAIYQNADLIKWFADNSNNFSFTKDTGSIVSGIINNVSSVLNIKVEAYRNGCITASDDMTIKSGPAKNISMTDPSPICDNKPTIPLITANPINSNSILWTTSGGTVSPNNTATSISYTPTSAEIAQGFAKIIVGTNEMSPLCPNKFDTTIVKLALPPTVIAPSDTILCESNLQKILLLKSINTYADTIKWSTNDVSASLDTPIGDSTNITLANNTTVVVTVTASKQGCPSMSDSTSITFATPPTLNGTIAPTCDTDQKLLLSGATSNTSIKDVIAWSRSSNNGSFGLDSTLLSNTYIPSQKDLDTGFVTLSLRHVIIDKCPAKDTSIKVIVSPFPKADAGKDSLLCRGSDITQKTNVNLAWTYEWRTNSDTNSAVISNSDSIYLNVNTDTTLFLTVRNALGCIAKDDAKLKVFDAPVIKLPQDFCLYDTTIINAVISNKPPIGIYKWQKGQQVLADTIESLKIMSSGTYIYSYKYNQCINADTIIANLPPIAKVNSFIDCINTAGVLTADSIFKATYLWDNNPPSSSHTFNVIATSGEREIPLTVRDSLGCENSVKTKVRGVPKPEFTLSANDVCDGNVGKIYLTLDDPSIEPSQKITYEWRMNNTIIKVNTPKEVSFTKSGDYSAKLNIGNCTTQKTIPVNIFPNPVIDIPKEHKYCFEDASPIKLESNKFAKYKWYSKDGLIDTTQSINVKPLVETNYGLTVLNQYGCKDSTPVVVHVSCPPRLFVPNIITPHTKDINSNLNIYGAFYTDFELTVFNRWGEIIYNTNDPRATWDGTYKGEDMPIGVYPWVVSYDAEYDEFKKPQKYKLKGDVTVVR